MGFIEMSFWDDFIARLSERAGKDKVFEALSLGKYEGTSRFIETILKGPLGYLARSQVGARRAYTLLTEFIFRARSRPRRDRPVQET